jgi:hypothetical protein
MPSGMGKSQFENVVSRRSPEGKDTRHLSGLIEISNVDVLDGFKPKRQGQTLANDDRHEHVVMAANGRSDPKPANRPLTTCARNGSSSRSLELLAVYSLANGSGS